MRRLDNVYERLWSIENVRLADKNASRGKSRRREIIEHRKNAPYRLQCVSDALREKTYRISGYRIFPIFEQKERIIYQLPYYPDNIVQHCIMNVAEDWFVRMFTADTYSCIKGRGIGGAHRNLVKALRDKENTTYFLKFDVRKFYPSVDHDILKQQLRSKIKDADFLWLLFHIIDSAPGLPIGNYTSQYLANFYLTGFDHWLKGVKKVRYYFRYADDVVILSKSKEELSDLFKCIQEYLRDNLKLEIKPNWQIAPVEARGIDFVGYVFRHKYIRIRKRVKKNFCRMAVRNRNYKSIASYKGMLDHCNGRHLYKKILGDESFQRLRKKRRTKKLHRGQNTSKQIIES